MAGWEVNIDLPHEVNSIILYRADLMYFSYLMGGLNVYHKISR